MYKLMLDVLPDEPADFLPGMVLPIQVRNWLNFLVLKAIRMFCIRQD